MIRPGSGTFGPMLLGASALPSARQRAHRARALLAHQYMVENGLAMELESACISSIPDNAPVPGLVGLLTTLKSSLASLPADERPAAAELDRALELIERHTAGAIRDFETGKTADDVDLPPDSIVGLEALVVADGTRPSFLIRNDQVDKNHPLVGAWKDTLQDFNPILKHAAGLVGRLQGEDGSARRYAGTGTLLDRENQLVLTNYHVVLFARNVLGVAMSGSSSKLSVHDPFFIDFNGESGSTTTNRYRVLEAHFPTGAGQDFSDLDVAVLRIEATAESKPLPHALPLSADSDLSSGSSSSFCTLGFPGEPETVAPPGASVDWNFVIKTIFNDRFGLKRIAPGQVIGAPGSHPDDAARRIMLHDATTFGGASGSLLLAWRREGSPAFGLHFAGATLSANYALAFSAVTEQLKELGLKI